MKRIITVFYVFLLIFLTALPVSAKEYEYDIDDKADIYGELYGALIPDGIENSLPDDVKEFLYEYELSAENPQSLNAVFSADSLKELFFRLLGYIMSPLKTASLLLTAIMLCSLLFGMRAKEQSEVALSLQSFAALCCAVMIISPVTQLITDCINVMNILSVFMTALIPVYAGLLIAAAKAGTALGFQTAVFIATQTVSYIATYIVSPFCSMYLALAVAGGVSGDKRLPSIGELIKKAAMWTMSISMTVYMAVFSIKNVVNTTADSAGAKTARFLITSFVPIVGASINDALGSMKGCIDVLCRSFGIYAVIIMLAVILPLLARLIFWRLLLSLCFAVSDMFCTEAVSALLKAVSNAIMILTACVVCTGVMFIFSTTVLTNAVTS